MSVPYSTSCGAHWLLPTCTPSPQGSVIAQKIVTSERSNFNNPTSDYNVLDLFHSCILCSVNVTPNTLAHLAAIHHPLLEKSPEPLCHLQSQLLCILEPPAYMAQKSPTWKYYNNTFPTPRWGFWETKPCRIILLLISGCLLLWFSFLNFCSPTWKKLLEFENMRSPFWHNKNISHHNRLVNCFLTI